MINIPISPMLAASTSNYTSLFDGRSYFISDKYDGVRIVSTYGVPYSRTGKPIRNLHIQELFKQLPKDLLIDGECMSCDMGKNKTFSDYSKDLMSINGKPNITYYIFDLIIENKTAEERYAELLKLSLPSFCRIIPQLKIIDYFSLESLEADAIKRFCEGVMLKDCKGIYKYGRSTIKEKGLIKVKRFSDSECIIENFEEKQTNTNEKEEDELGFAKRSSCLEGMVPAGTLGSLQVKMLDSDIRFSIGSGFNDSLRQEIWNNREEYIGKVVKFKYFPSGMLLAPRFPIFLGFRDPDDVL